ncbi:polysaccharide pyruvyl transferase CsaB [Syntrophomonas erecta]
MKIALSGYYGFDNAGDEALLSAITSTIKRLEPSANFVVLSGYPGKTARLHGLRAVNRINPFSVTREIRGSDLLISGGGSLFQDVTGPFSLPYYISIVALAKLLRKPVIFYAQGVGPINRRYSKLLMRWIANQVDIITLRDDDSLQLLQRIGVTRPPTLVTADPVFTLQPGEQDEHTMKKLLEQVGIHSSSLVGVSVRQWTPLEGYQTRLASLLDRLVRTGLQVVFIPMEYPADIAESVKVSHLMQEKSLVLDRQFSSQEHLALISHLHLMIGMRLHSLIFAASQQIPFLGISYDPKIDAFLKLFNLKPLDGDVDQMYMQVEGLLQDRIQLEKMRATAGQFREKAEQTARLALSLIKK